MVKRDNLVVLALASGDEDDLAGQAGDVCVWVEGVGSHCISLVLLEGGCDVAGATKLK